MMQGICYSSRDNARTPMQWDTSLNAGFTQGIPWMKVNPNYKHINAKQQINDHDSIYNFYKQIIQLRHTMPIIVYGKYQLIDENHPDLFNYTREYENQKLLVVTNFSGKNVEYDIPNQFQNGKILITNEKENNVFKEQMMIQPYGAYVIIVE